MENNNKDYLENSAYVVANLIIKDYEDNFLIKNQKNKEWNDKYYDLSKLKLQKILYLTYGHFYKKTGKQLFQAEFEAWHYGPVINKIYKKGDDKRFDSIKKEYNEEYTKIKLQEWEPKEQAYFYNLIHFFFLFSAWVLVDETHKTSPWIDSYNKGNKTKIKTENIENYFKKIDDINENSIMIAFKD